MKRLILTAALALGLALPAIAQAHVSLPQPIYFWGSTATAVSVPKGQGPAPNTRLIRPPMILMFADGSWDIGHLRWSGWGSSVAHASGISSASNGIPNQAEGKRIKQPAQVALSNPGRFQGHEVYRCFTLTVASYPASDEHLCLKAQGGYTYFESTALHLDDFLSPDGKVWCAMGSPMFCATGGSPSTASADPAQRGATLTSGGKVTTCFVAVPSVSQVCTQNWDSSAPVLRYGQQSEVDGFRCTSAKNGITCIVVAGKGAGKGFLISGATVRRVGP
jgi:hypothetical protein